MTKSQCVFARGAFIRVCHNAYHVANKNSLPCPDGDNMGLLATALVKYKDAKATKGGKSESIIKNLDNTLVEPFKVMHTKETETTKQLEFILINIFFILNF